MRLKAEVSKMSPRKFNLRFEVTPWRTREEFIVTKLAFKNNSCPKVWKTAVENMLVWQVRMGHQLPDIYRVSRNVLLHLLHIETDPAKFDAASAGNALSRFIQYFTEKNDKQNNDLYKVSDLAQEVHIPEWVVEIRHDAIHRIMPSLSLLKPALEFARTYLWENYWSNVLMSSNISDDAFHEKVSAYIGERDKKISRQLFKDLLATISPQHVAELVRDVALSMTQAEIKRDENDSSLYCPHFLLALWKKKYFGIASKLSSAGLLDMLVLQLCYYMRGERTRAGIVVEPGLAAAWTCLILNDGVGRDITEHTLATVRRICQEHLDENSQQVLESLPEVSDKLQDLTKPVHQTEENSTFRLATDKEWSRIPIGHIFYEDLSAQAVPDDQSGDWHSHQSADEDCQSDDSDTEMDLIENDLTVDTNSSNIDFTQADLQIF